MPQTRRRRQKKRGGIYAETAAVAVGAAALYSKIKLPKYVEFVELFIRVLQEHQPLNTESRDHKRRLKLLKELFVDHVTPLCCSKCNKEQSWFPIPLETKHEDAHPPTAEDCCKKCNELNLVEYFEALLNTALREYINSQKTQHYLRSNPYDEKFRKYRDGLHEEAKNDPIYARYEVITNKTSAKNSQFQKKAAEYEHLRNILLGGLKEGKKPKQIAMELYNANESLPMRLAMKLRRQLASRPRSRSNRTYKKFKTYEDLPQSVRDDLAAAEPKKDYLHAARSQQQEAFDSSSSSKKGNKNATKKRRRQQKQRHVFGQSTAQRKHWANFQEQSRAQQKN